MREPWAEAVPTRRSPVPCCCYTPTLTPSGNIASIWSGCAGPDPGFPANAVASSELIDLFVQADTVLEQTLQETLTRAALGLGEEGQDENGGST